MDLFGFEIKRKTEKELSSFVEPSNDESSIDIISTTPGVGASMSVTFDLDGNAKSEADLVQKYRNMMMQPEVQHAVDDIVNEAIIIDENEKIVSIVTDGLKNFPGSLRKKISDEFETVLKLLDFHNQGYDYFSKWYVDGRINFHAVIDENNPKKGIQELRYIDPRKLRKIREFERVQIGDGANRTYIKKLKDEYYVYTEFGFAAQLSGQNASNMQYSNIEGLRISPDSIIHGNSGILNETNTLVLSHLDKAYKPLNQLRMMEDASVIYRISRAPERRVFYIDVGNLPKVKAEQYLREMMVKHKNRLVYDINSGDIRDDRRHMSMTDDFWLPRREGGKGTEITTLPGGQNLGEMEDILYFQKRLYKALNVPIARMESETGFSLGRASEISRDEVKFSKFIKRLRNRFSIVFDKVLEKQLILKGIVNSAEWEQIKAGIKYDFTVDNQFEELKEMEVVKERIQTLQDIDAFAGKYYSRAWIRRNVLRQSDEEIKEIDKEMKAEEALYGDEETGDDEDETSNVPEKDPHKPEIPTPPLPDNLGKNAEPLNT